MPQIYSGDEIAMRGREDPDNRHDFPGGFSNQGSNANAFTLAGRTSEQQDVFSALQTLLHLRAQESDITQGQQQNIFADDTAFAFLRGTQLTSGCTGSGTQRILVIAAKNTVSRTLQLETNQTALESCGHFVQLYPATPVAMQRSGSTIDLTFPPNAFIIYRVTQ
jgi:glycosidase